MASLIAMMLACGRLSIVADPRYFQLDEGFNLIKALLISRGFSLHTEIWSDQPPVVPVLFSYLYDLAGNRVAVFRGAVLTLFVFSSGMLLAAVRQRCGAVAAWSALLALLLSAELLEFSVLALIGIPAISFAMLALAAQLRSQSSRVCDTPLLIAAAAFALSLGCKLWTGLIFIPALVQMAIDTQRGARLRKLGVYTATTASFTLILLLPALINPTEGLDQLLLPHAALSLGQLDPAAIRIGRGEIVRTFTYWLNNNPRLRLVLLGALIAALLHMRRGSLRLPALWFLLSLAVLAVHRPFNDHHAAMLLVPAALLFGMSVAALPGVLTRKRAAGYARLLTILVSLALQGYYYAAFFIGRTPYQDDRWRYHVVDEALLRRAAASSAGIHYVLTDQPYFAFLLDRPVPPDLAVISAKRIATGRLTVPRTLASIQRFGPELLWFDRFIDTFDEELLRSTDLRRYVELRPAGAARIFAQRGLPMAAPELGAGE